MVATLQLTGDYSGATFTVGSDGHGGTDITVTGASAVPPLAAAAPSGSVHALVSAMAGLATSAGSSAVTPATVEGCRSMLITPKPYMV